MDTDCFAAADGFKYPLRKDMFHLPERKWRIEKGERKNDDPEKKGTPKCTRIHRG